MTILGIETSCDETAAAVVIDGYKLKSSVIASSQQFHAKYGGIVPEIASRKQLELIMPVIEESLISASLSWENIDAVAVTYGPGLGGSLLIGVLTAKTLALVKKLPIYRVNHLQSHIYANFITETNLKGYALSKTAPGFPFLGIIISGGHTNLVMFYDRSSYQVIGQTRDDAIGEAFDKVAKLLGLPYPGGPSISNAAVNGNPRKYSFPEAKMPGLDFSFSGIKTAVLRTAQKLIGEDYQFPSHKLSSRLTSGQKADLAASFQETIVNTLVNKTALAAKQYSPKSLVLSGGVAANKQIRERLKIKIDLPLFVPDIKLCTDNAAMVASAAYYLKGAGVKDPLTLETEVSLTL